MYNKIALYSRVNKSAQTCENQRLRLPWAVYAEKIFAFPAYRQGKASYGSNTNCTTQGIFQTIACEWDSLFQGLVQIH